MSVAAADYAYYAGQRVAADTLALEKQATLAAFTSPVSLPSDLVELEGIFNGSTPLVALPGDDLLASLSGASTWIGDLSYSIIGRQVYFLPTPNLNLTILYRYRPAEGEALVGQEGRLTDRLVNAYTLLDDGQPEVGIFELDRYSVDAMRARRQNRTAGGVTTRIAVRETDPWL